jgi:tetratricopeptide (TPR) repeat protein
MNEGILPSELGVDLRYCAGSGYTLLAEELFDQGRLSDASRHLSTAIRLLEAKPANTRLLLGALRMQGAMYVERGMRTEALALIDRLKAMPLELPAQKAIIQGLTGAYHQAAGNAPAAERAYLLAIANWDSMRRAYDSVAERSNLGVLYIASGRFDDAVVVLEGANSLLASPKSRSARHRLVVMNNLAVAYSERGDTAEAVRHAREAVRLADAGGGRTALAVSVYSNCAAVLRAAGRKQEANELENQAGRAAIMANNVVDMSELSGANRRR